MPHAALKDGFRQLLDAAADAMLVVDGRGDVVVLNPEAERIFGFTEAELVDEPLHRLIPPRFRQLVRSPQVEGEVDPDPVTLFALRRDGTEFPIEFNQNRLETGRDALTLVTVRDLTRWRRAQEALYREKEQAFVTLSSIADGIITTNRTGTITYMNPTAERLSGWRTTEALGQPLSTVLPLVSETTRQPIEDIPTRCLREDRTVDLIGDVLLVRRDGTEVPLGDSAAPLRDRNGATIGVVMVFHDVTERRRTIHTLTQEASHDSLTGLINRLEFERRVGRVRAATEEGEEHALCYLDLDGFKFVNDSAGHEAGDELLKAISRLANDRIRSRDTVARLGGDEFGVLLEHCALAKAQEIATDLQQAIEDLDFRWKEEPFPIGASIGVVPITATSGRTADLLRAADAACYAAKEAGGSQVQIGQETADGTAQISEDRRALRLTRALEEGGFELLVQPLMFLGTETRYFPRCEILLRLPDERGGLETPEAFLPHAVRYRLVPAIDRWVVKQTIVRLAAWHEAHPQCEIPICSINLSVSSLGDRDLVPALREYLEEYRLPPESLNFELGEAALGNFAQLVRLISELRAVGCGVGLEEFGSGLSSFAHLKALLVDYVKIGGHYVRSVAGDPVYRTLVAAVNDVGKHMGITVMADEVDDEDTLERLRELGVAYAQGNAVAPAGPLVHLDGSVDLPCVERSA
jgi:diguanylate cyclase (GGDEF)-like protein/PAS domain S-box-containing protein